MKQRLVLSIVFGVLAVGYGFSQSITGAEYFYDNDPGIGEGIPITISSPFDSIDQSFSIVMSDTLDPGYHWLYIRSRDADGRWSISRGHKIYIYADANPNTVVDQPDISGLEYFIDTDPGVGMATWVANTPVKDTIDENIALAMTGLSPGYHYLYTRPRDVAGRWGVTYVQKFYIFEEGIVNEIVKGPPIIAAEYFFDEEVPFGQGTPLTLSKGDSVEWEGQIEVTGLSAGEHNLIIRVQDSVGSWSIAYAEPFSVVGLSSTHNSPICQGSSDGWAKVSITGGKPPFTFLWDDPEQQADSIATGLMAGSYTVTVQDSEGAVIRETVAITEFDTIDISITTSDTECKLGQGSATAIAGGENPPYRYLWTNGSEEAFATGLQAGIYEVTVTDNAGCQNKAVATVNDIGGPQISIDSRIKHLNCAGDADGIIDPLISGGTAPYTYSWSNGETSKGIQDLKAGTYELTVVDAQECIASKSIRIEEPQPITFTLSVAQADCGLSNGYATVSVMGGSQPYAYNWTGFTAPHNATRTGLGAGVYEVTVIDGSGCSAIAQVAVGESGAPSVNVTAVDQSTCGNTDGSILISVAGGTGAYVYDWRDASGSTVGTGKDLTGVGPGEYNVSVSDGTGCKTYAAATIPAELPPAELICLVTVDTGTNKNLVVWDETSGQGIVAYRLYRETTSAGVFDSIAYIPVDSLSQYIDELADPKIRSWRYKIASINDCGVESRLSPAHKTMHLTVNLGLLDRVNLLWNHYEGFIPMDNNYRIWRHTAGIGWEKIDSIPSNLNSYTDENAPDADLQYYVEAVHPTGCTPLKASTLNSSRSNRKNKLKSNPEAVNSFSAIYNLIVYPNPSYGTFKLLLDLDRTEDLYIRVYDMSGKLVYLNEIIDVHHKLIHELNLSGHEKGVYHLNLQTEKGIFNKSIVIQ